MEAELERVIFDAGCGASLPGKVARREGDPPCGDPAVDEAYAGAGATYDLFRDVYGRLSIDGRGLCLASTVHYRTGYDNAFWNREQMVYGDGDEDLPPDQRLFNRFTLAVDIIAHELAHGVNQYEANLAYAGQSGALSETFSDIFGALTQQYCLNQTARQAEWIIGQGLFTQSVRGVGLRSLKAPGTAYDDPVLGRDPQPAHMRDYKYIADDHGGVHINSGISNHAFYVTAVELGGYAWEKAGKIWYTALCDRLSATSDFQTAAFFTYQTAGELYGAGSLEQGAVKRGWAEVGIGVDAPPEQGAGCLTAGGKLLQILVTRRLF
jgi:Zn-dependent metalloprotease